MSLPGSWARSYSSHLTFWRQRIFTQTVAADPPPLPKATNLTDPKPDRKALRQDLRAARAAFAAALSPVVRDALEKALATHLPQLGPPGILASYCAVGDEIDPRHLEEAARAAGWRIALPRVTEGPLSFHAQTALTPGYKGIPEPPADAPLLRPDLLLVPLLAADRAGNRMGQGKGHYDRTLAALRGAGSIRAIGLAWDMQLADALPAEPWDQPLDAIATPTIFHLTPFHPEARGAKAGG